MNRRRIPAQGFTLIELLVVVAIISLLLAILLPSLNSAREQAKAVKCGSNMRGCGQAVHEYLAEERATFPPSYQYLDSDGSIVNQPGGGPAGYLHWSYALFSGGKVQDEFFQCPSFDFKGGCPRTNPGDDHGNWNDQQVDQNGQTHPNGLTDKQATRMAYTANAAIISRNKWTTSMSGGIRTNKSVNESDIKNTGNVILVTEFNRNWRAEALYQGSGYLSKSHRPVNPFWNASGGYNEYLNSPSPNAVFYYVPREHSKDRPYGLAPMNVIENGVGLIDGASGSELNAVGRHHPGGDQLGGSTNFLYVDGHVERKTLLQTLENREWGDHYYSITGPNKVYDRYGEIRTP